MHVLDILEELAKEPSRKGKIKIISKYKGHKLFEEVAVAALDPRERYYMDSKTLPLPEGTCKKTYPDSLKKAMEFLPKLQNRDLSGNKLITWMQNTLASMSEKDCEVFCRIIMKDLKCGVAVKTLNKGFGEDLISLHPYMGCQPFNEKNIQRINYPAFAQVKEDGCYNDIEMVKTEKHLLVGPVTRQGTRFKDKYSEDILKALDILYKAVEKLGQYSYGMVFQCELMMYEEDMYTVMPRKKSNGILNSDISEEEKKRVFLVVWDVVDRDMWLHRKDTTPYFVRYERLSKVFQSSLSKNSHVKLVETVIVGNEQEAYEFFDNTLNRGLEGAILKNMTAVWKDGKSPDQVKMKGVRECDLEIVEVYEGKGKYAGMVGGFICKSSCGKLEVNVGGGFSDEQRSNMWDLVGKIVAVKYNEVIDSKTKHEVKSLFLPRKACSDGTEIRFDKDEADSLEEILGEKVTKTKKDLT